MTDRGAITAATLTAATGAGLGAFRDAIRSGRTGLRANDLDWLDVETAIGRVSGIEEHTLPAAFAAFDCRNNRLADMALAHDGFEAAVADAMGRYGAGRIAVIAGTSTSGILDTEFAYRERDSATGALPDWFRLETTHAYNSLADFLRARLGLAGPAWVISTACSSSARAVADACDLLAADLCDAVVVAGVDTLCRLTVRGFSSLDLIDPEPNRPFDVTRAGISVGEAAGYLLLERPPAAAARPRALINGCGESSDAYHMSSPDPEGRGARDAMTAALAAAGLEPGDIDHLVLHGTGTAINDRIENAAVYAVFGDGTSAASVKGWTGHTLGAAGMVGIATALVCLEDGIRPANLGLTRPDPAFRAPIRQETAEAPVHNVLTNAFGFGGSNCCIALGAAA